MSGRLKASNVPSSLTAGLRPFLGHCCWGHCCWGRCWWTAARGGQDQDGGSTGKTVPAAAYHDQPVPAVTGWAGECRGLSSNGTASGG
jgi:hypothetical protein